MRLKAIMPLKENVQIAVMFIIDGIIIITIIIKLYNSYKHLWTTLTLSTNNYNQISQKYFDLWILSARNPRIPDLSK
jgi:hypothetical protein